MSRIVSIDWEILAELYYSAISRTERAGLRECNFCGQTGELPSNIEHDLCGNDPCPVKIAHDILWPSELAADRPKEPK